MCMGSYLNIKLVGKSVIYIPFELWFIVVYTWMFIWIETCRAICNAYEIPIMVHFFVYEWLFELENGKAIYNSSSISIMVHFGYMGGYLNLECETKLVDHLGFWSILVCMGI